MKLCFNCHWPLPGRLHFLSLKDPPVLEAERNRLLLFDRPPEQTPTPCTLNASSNRTLNEQDT